jgi:hypothetical protein
VNIKTEFHFFYDAVLNNLVIILPSALFRFLLSVKLLNAANTCSLSCADIFLALVVVVEQAPNDDDDSAIKRGKKGIFYACERNFCVWGDFQ